MAKSASSNKRPRRLGRGLSSLIETPVQVGETEIEQTPEVVAAQDVAPASETTGGLHMVAVGELEPNPHQPRSEMDEAALKVLADSISGRGVMQPIVVRRGSGGAGYQIVAGERRWRAAQLAGLDRVPVVIHELSDEESAEWALVENLQREDLNPIERGRAFQALAEGFGLSQADIAARVGIDRSSVANLMRLLELEPSILRLISAGSLSAGHGKALLGMPPGSGREQYAKVAAAQHLSVRRIEADARQSAKTVTESKKVESGHEVENSQLAKQLSEQLGTRVHVRTNASRNRGTLTIAFYDVEQFEGLMDRLGLQLD